MKERIKKIIFILLWFAGLVLCAALIKYYLPEWVYYTFLGLFLAWFVWDSSKPEKEDDLHKKIHRLNDLTILYDWIGGKSDYDELKIKIMDEQEKIVKSIKL